MIQYRNRDNNLIEFTDMRDGTVEMKFDKNDKYRYGPTDNADETDLYMIDPAGGPYICIGQPMVRAQSEWEGKIISSITATSNKTHNIFILKLNDE